MFCAEYLGQNPANFATVADRLLQLTKVNLDRARVWLVPEVCARLSQAIEEMHIAVARLSANGTTPKGNVLLDNLRAQSNTKNGVAVLVARGDTSPDELSRRSIISACRLPSIQWVRCLRTGRSSEYSSSHGRGRKDLTGWCTSMQRSILDSWPIPLKNAG